MADDPNLVPKEDLTTREIVDTEAMRTSTSTTEAAVSPAITEDKPEIAVAVKVETAESEKSVPLEAKEEVVSSPGMAQEVKAEQAAAGAPIVEEYTDSKDSATSSSRATTNGGVAIQKSSRKRPRKLDPSGKSRDSSGKHRDSSGKPRISSGKPRDPSSKSRDPPVKPRRPLLSKLSSRPKKPKRRYDGYLDEITTHSETSENLFSEINWEENLDCDTSALVDEFAPRPTKPIKPKTSEIKIEETISSIPIIPIPPVVEVVEPGTNSPMTAQEFRPGTKISVLDYKSSTWNRGTVTEVDWEEDEVLIIYDDRCKEWVSMSSQRLSRCNSNEPGPKDGTVEPISSEFIRPYEEKPVTLPSPKLDCSSRIPSSTSLAARKRARARSSGSAGGGGRSRSRKDSKRKRPSQPTAPTVASRSSSVTFSQDSPMSDGKFEVGEKVLAKWSDFRMQKFPAIIKKIAGKGLYDLLFYDGFEKTIRAENVFKTTEEEVAKYKRTNPSEADIFVDIDADSKEARRQRKKKSFGDSFLSDSEYPRKRSIGGNLSPLATTPVRPDSVQSGSSSAKQSERHELPQFTSSMKRSRHARRSNEEAPSGEAAESVLPGVSHEPLKLEEPMKPKDRFIDRERFLGDIPEGARPLKISLPNSDVFHISVIMPDKRLPPGWVKHCVKREGAWKAFVLSPDRFKITNRAELSDYAHKTLGTKNPKKISFQFLEDILPDLIEKQKDLEPSEDFQQWVRRKPSRKPKPTPLSTPLPPAVVQSPLPDPIQTGIERDTSLLSPKLQGCVKTLLPKNRAPVPVPPAHATTVVPADDSDATGLLKCIKEGCDKKFRKESLLHMHLKHYHEDEYRRIVTMAPRVDELASARTGSGYKAESPIKPSPPPIKKPTPKVCPQTSDASKTDSPPTPLVSHAATEEKKTTIKTLLPRQSTSQDTAHSHNVEAMEVKTAEDDFTVQSIKNRAKKPKLEPQVGSALAELGYPSLVPPPPASGSKHIKKKMPSIEKSESLVADEGKSSPSYEMTDDGVLIERLRSEELINCICGFREEDGLMIQCDICMCWQHGICSGMMTDSDVPERYVCYICRNPPKVRSSQKYSYALHYLTQGKLASFTFRKKDENDLKQKEGIIKKCYDILGSLHNMENVECSLRAKLNIAQRSDHPKLYLWAKNWENQTKKETDPSNDQSGSRIPVPEAPIDLDECRSRLLDHIDSYIEQLDTRLNTIHSQLLVLDSQDDSSEQSDSDKLTKQVVHTINKDLMTVKKLAKIE